MGVHEEGNTRRWEHTCLVPAETHVSARYYDGNLDSILTPAGMLIFHKYERQALRPQV